MNLKKLNLVLNIEEPEQAELHQFITMLPNGKRRNASAFLRMLADRAYQAQKKEKTETKNVIRGTNGGIKIRFDD
ncbi:hypothetical protein ACQKGD_27670 [Peribacillus frigoritolerans]|uniref:hypothetical protein n=1 Tax=Peribacillus frigoritolerans TaxID=450367 RepID=UPI003D03F5FF